MPPGRAAMPAWTCKGKQAGLQPHLKSPPTDMMKLQHTLTKASSHVLRTPSPFKQHYSVASHVMRWNATVPYTDGFIHMHGSCLSIQHICMWNESLAICNSA